MSNSTREHCDDKAYRGVIEFTRYDGSSGACRYGPYSTIAPAKGMITRQLKWIRRNATVTATYVEYATGWERVD